MDIIENSIPAKLRREQNDFIHKKADTVCIKEFNESFWALGKKVGPFKVSFPYQLDNYIARILVEYGILRYEDKSQLNNSAIQKINFQESTNRELRKIQDHVYVRALEQLQLLESLLNKKQITRIDRGKIFHVRCGLKHLQKFFPTKLFRA